MIIISDINFNNHDGERIPGAETKPVKEGAMKQWLAVGVAAVALSAQVARGAVVEIKNLSEAFAGALRKGTLVVFDIDNTILQTTQTLGSVQWADWYERELKAQGLPADEANRISSGKWVQINRSSGAELVEQVTPNIIANLQARGFQVLALTARPTSILLQTLRDLPRFGIHFGRSWPSARFNSPFPGAAYSGGILFVGQTNSKGAVLKEFLRQNSLRPSAIRFVDDKRKYVDSLEQAFEGSGIFYVGYRYGGADYRVAHFDARLAKFAQAYFDRTGIVLSDTRARQLMQAQQAVN